MYVVLARKYRPQTLDEVIGQPHIVQSLRGAVEKEKAAHAYLFCGPRGIGKTSLARILARILNCERGPAPEPCGTCDVCREIAAGSATDVLEIDGASNRGIEEIRSLRENVNLMPAKSRYKIYIIDEVHMLTPEAFNALLKTLEEPPDYVKFIFATTAPEKVPATIVSRCQKYPFHPLTPADMKKKIREIGTAENFEIEDEALEKVIEFSGGSMRDCLSILDQLLVYAPDDRIRSAQVDELLGLMEEKGLRELILLARTARTSEALLLLHRFLSEGKDPGVLLDGIIRKFRNMGFSKIGAGDDFGPDEKEFLRRFTDLPVEGILDILALAMETKERLRRGASPVILLEVFLLKLARTIGRKEGEEKPVFEKPSVVAEAPEPAFGGKHAGKDAGKDVKEHPVRDVPEAPERTPASVPQGSLVLQSDEEPKPSGKEPAAAWPEILARVKTVRKTLEACLREGRLERVGDQEAVIAFPAKWAFHSSVVEKPANLKIVEKVVSEVLGRRMKVRMRLLEPTSSSENPPDRKSLLEKPEVKEVIQLFDGQIVDVEETDGGHV